MKKRKQLLVTASVVFVVLVGIAPLHAQDANIGPCELDFGDVAVGDTATLRLTIASNDWQSSLQIDSIQIIDDPASVFEITNIDPDSFPIYLGGEQTVRVDVTFAPSVSDTFNGVLLINSNDHDEPEIEVTLAGQGFETDEPTPGELIDETIAFFDMSVDDGMLYGRRYGWFARLRLCFMRKMLVIADEFIAQDRINAACFILKRAYKRCDEAPWPPDFVVGEAVSDLAGMIDEVRASLGCD